MFQRIGIRVGNGEGFVKEGRVITGVITRRFSTSLRIEDDGNGKDEWSFSEFVENRKGVAPLDDQGMEYLSRMVRLDFDKTRERDQQLAYDVNEILQFIDDINTGELEDGVGDEKWKQVAPMSSPVESVQMLDTRRDDDVRVGALTEEEALGNAGVKHPPFFVVPKVIEE